MRGGGETTENDDFGVFSCHFSLINKFYYDFKMCDIMAILFGSYHQLVLCLKAVSAVDAECRRGQAEDKANRAR